jgi:hypothetical protein
VEEVGISPGAIGKLVAQDPMQGLWELRDRWVEERRNQGDPGGVVGGDGDLPEIQAAEHGPDDLHPLLDLGSLAPVKAQALLQQQNNHISSVSKLFFSSD